MFQANFVQKIKTHFVLVFCFQKVWKNIVEPGRPRMTILRVHVACWIPKATNTYSEYVILIVFSLQQWLDEPPQCYICTMPVFVICDGECLLHGTNWVFKGNRLLFVLKRRVSRFSENLEATSKF